MPAMRTLVAAAFLLVVVTAVAGCGDKAPTVCEKYARLEWDCGDYPAAEKEITLKMAAAMCEGALAEKDDGNAMVKMFRAEVECAKTSADCAAYQACQDRATAEPATEPAPAK
jgi:hypothetical protein